MTPISILRSKLSQDGTTLVPLRILLGWGFLLHGYGKVTRGPEKFVEILTALHVPAPELMTYATIFVEIVGGAALMVGAFVTVASLPLGVVMLTAVLGVHLPNGFSGTKLRSIGPDGPVFGPTGYELPLFYLVATLVFAVTAPTAYSVDRWLETRRSSRKRLSAVHLPLTEATAPRS